MKPPIRSAHVDDTVQAIARLRADHDQKATPLERTVDRLTGWAANPRFVVLLSLVLRAPSRFRLTRNEPSGRQRCRARAPRGYRIKSAITCSSAPTAE
jgi:hypothetical protein